jgi:hypothetical protein
MRVNPLARPSAKGHLPGMADKDKEREERLAAALRENLRRRKAQARELTNAAKDSDDQP